MYIKCQSKCTSLSPLWFVHLPCYEGTRQVHKSQLIFIQNSVQVFGSQMQEPQLSCTNNADGLLHENV